jgi:hypothetical protein
MRNSPGFGRRDQIVILSPVVKHGVGEMAFLIAVDPHFPLSILIRVVPVKKGVRRDMRFFRRGIIKVYPQDVASRAVVHLAVPSNRVVAKEQSDDRVVRLFNEKLLAWLAWERRGGVRGGRPGRQSANMADRCKLCFIVAIRTSLHPLKRSRRPCCLYIQSLRCSRTRALDNYLVGEAFNPKCNQERNWRETAEQ